MSVPDFLIWHCAGCGKPAKGKEKPCDCATNVGTRPGPNGGLEQTWWDDPAVHRRWKSYVEGMEAHLDEDGKINNSNVYDLIQMVKQLSDSLDGSMKTNTTLKGVLDELRTLTNRLRAEASRSGTMPTASVLRMTDPIMDALMWCQED